MDAIDINKAIEFVMKCMNFDGGFGSKPGAESHAGMIYCSIGLLSITGNFFFLFWFYIYIFSKYLIQ